MKFENVSILIDTLSPRLQEFGHTVESNGKIEQRQRGYVCSVFRLRESIDEL
jgi:hypothetical protein